MKKAFLFTLLYMLAGTAALWAQDYKVKLEGKTNKIVLEMRGSRVTLEGYNGNEIVIQGNGYQPPPKQAEGLRVLSGAEDNTRIGLFVTQQDQAVRVVEASRRPTHYVIRLPRQLSVVFKQNELGGGNFKATDLTGDIEVRLQGGRAELLNMSGGVVVSGMGGGVTVRYAAIGKSPSAISTLGGDIDVTMPASSKTTLQLHSMGGEVYTDFEVSVRSKGDDLRKVGGPTNGGTVNGGGTNVSLQTLSGNIFLRKAK
ncbi:hypothetical protein [Hymenobacter arizonensis]|uniref:Adhesin n=1 Tax=Hymenobacter arizonensis TaxID=1227077 RepID=A0A1I6BIZ7_HYMAR|nr:hypothetical protein [Hymenobacter arizonensis]SFQ80891.1 hypothetical protein SAMN04515668_4590 [Hymenobacter arizonensis]